MNWSAVKVCKSWFSEHTVVPNSIIQTVVESEEDPWVTSLQLVRVSVSSSLNQSDTLRSEKSGASAALLGTNGRSCSSKSPAQRRSDEAFPKGAQHCCVSRGYHGNQIGWDPDKWQQSFDSKSYLGCCFFYWVTAQIAHDCFFLFYNLTTYLLAFLMSVN